MILTKTDDLQAMGGGLPNLLLNKRMELKALNIWLMMAVTTSRIVRVFIDGGVNVH